MSKLPSLRPRQVMNALRHAGFRFDHQTGSHAIYEKPGHPLIITVPMHNKDLKKGTLHSIIKQTGLSAGEFIKLI